MADEIIIETVSAEVIEVGVVGPQGPAGAAGTGLETLTTQGDTLYRGAATGERLPIGTTGQILRVSASGIPEWGAAPASGVISVNDQTGEVFLDSTDILTEQALQISDAGTADCNGVFIYGGLFNGRPTYYATKDTFVYWDGSNWVINHNGEDQYFGTATTYAWQAVWSLGDGANPLPVVTQAASHEFEQVVGQRTNPTSRGDAAGKNVGTGANDVAAGNHTHTAATQSVAGFLSVADKTKLDGIASGATANTASNATPSALGTAAAGTSTDFARADHVHAIPSANDVGALSNTANLGDLDDAESARINLGLGTAAASDSTDFAAATHAASHAAGGSDAITIEPSQVVATSGFGIWGSGESLIELASYIPYASQPLGLDGGGLGTDVTAFDGLVKISGSAASAVGIGTGSTQVAAGNHTHELTALAATGAANGTILTANGSGGVTFAAASGGGSGGTKTYAVFTALDNNPPATDFATIDQRNSVACLDFSDTATESAVFVGVMPEGAVLTNGLIVRLHWMGTATTGNVRWSVAFERGNTDLDTDSFDTATAATATTNGTSGIVTVTAITCTNIDSIAAGDLFRLRVQRLGADAADSMIGAKGCELVAVEVRSAA